MVERAKKVALTRSMKEASIKMVTRVHPLRRCFLLLLWALSPLGPALTSAGRAARSTDAVASLNAGRWAEARERAEASIRQATRAGDAVTVYQSYGHLGRAYRMLNQPSAALAAYRKALDGAEQAGDKASQIPFAYQIGALRLQSDGPAAALPDLTHAQTLAQENKDRYYEAWADLRIGEAYDQLGDYERADDYYRQAWTLHRQLGDAEGVCYDYKNLGDYQLVMGDHESASDLYTKGLDIARDERVANRARLQAMIGGNLGLVALRRGDYEGARGYYEQARQLAQTINDRPLLQTALGQLGTIALRTGDPAAARSLLDPARAMAAATGQRAAEGFWWSRLGDAHLQLGEIAKAEAFYRLGRDRGRELGYSQLIEEATAGLGAVKEAQGDPAAALDLYTEAIAHIERERQRLVLDKEKVGYFVDKLPVYERLVDLLVRLHRSEPGRDYGRRAFEYAERAKGQAFLQKVPQGMVLKYLKGASETYRAWDADYQKKRERLYGRLLAARRELDRPTKDGRRDEPQKKAKQSEIAEWERALAEQEKGHVQFIAYQVRRLFPQLVQLYEPEILGVERTQALLAPEEVLVAYHVQEEKTVAFVVRKRAMDIVTLDFGRAQREDLMRVLEGVRWAKTWKEKNHLRGDALLAGLEVYYRKLFAPVELFIPSGSALILVPDDYLHYVPFGALVTARRGGAAQYLVARYPLSYTDSASLLSLARQTKPKVGAEPTLDALLLGNPDLHGPGAENLGDLPYAEAEVDALRPYFKRAQVLKGRAATEGAFKAHAGKARVIHVASHHILDGAIPWRSRLVLALDPQVNRDGNDGLVYTYELFALDLNAELVVLSACNSGSGTVRLGEGLEGPTRALQYAGARSVLATLWWVNDEATGTLMPRFYNYLAQGLDKRRALQQAQIDLIKAGYPHPHYWACFRLSGDTAPLQTALQRPAAWSRRRAAAPIGLVMLVAVAITVRRIIRKKAR